MSNEHSYDRLCDRYTKTRMIHELINLQNVYLTLKKKHVTDVLNQGYTIYFESDGIITRIKRI